MKILAPAKINLFLEIENKRPDGYHNIVSIMQTVSLFDELIIKKAESGVSLSCTNKKLGCGEGNLVMKAAKMLQRELGIKKGASIALKKNIPLGAGLGGGSSDAAAALKGLIKLWKIKISNRKLNKLAGRLGADVPFFLKGGTAEVSGIGDIIKPLKNMKKTYFLLVYPGFGVITKWAYQNLKFPLTNKRKINTIKALLESGIGSERWSAYIYNRFEEVVFPKYPEILSVKDKMKDYCSKLLMSGSGSSIFGVVPSREAGKSLKRQLSKSPLKVWLVQSFASR